jgi:hypothetical protein
MLHWRNSIWNLRLRGVWSSLRLGRILHSIIVVILRWCVLLLIVRGFRHSTTAIMSSSEVSGLFSSEPFIPFHHLFLLTISAQEEESHGN